MNSTENWYNQKGTDFFVRTAYLDTDSLLAPFIARLPPNAEILDAGCGSGRDSKRLTELGFRVTAIDGSAAMVELARAHTGLSVAHIRFDEIIWDSAFDGIWACASLLHVPRAELKPILDKLVHALRPGGVWFMSFKAGDGERLSSGRHFTDFTPESLHAFLAHFPILRVTELWQAPDSRPEIREEWVSAIVRKA